jgi:flavin reductase (DIM6/NTAB) family NADH-FMN oxidoreductase RutF
MKHRMEDIARYTAEDLAAMPQRYRAAMINSVGGFKSAVLIGTCNAAGQHNLAVFNSLFHLGANPPLLGFIARPDVSPRHTLANILETGYFTVNHIHRGIYKAAHQTSARYPQEVSEFDATGLSPLFESGCIAPFVKEAHIRLACAFEQRILIEKNDTSLIIGAIQSVVVPAHCVEEDGYIDIEKAGTLAISGLDGYHTTQRLERLPYAKANT